MIGVFLLAIIADGCPGQGHNRRTAVPPPTPQTTARSDLTAWVRQPCNVHSAPDDKADVVGYLTVPTAISVTDIGGGWLKLNDGPARNLKTNALLTDEEKNTELYVWKSFVSDEDPAEWLPADWEYKEPAIKLPTPVVEEQQTVSMQSPD
ncbi:hypothetical protein RISK_005979 [Rhodopirellula islandica]|uniref:Uncharacterized protein n=1 Tax=Rhodopirellula islandica TaxID=595434 RepID=A0A0J1B4L7_RHOIS|nr:hypothetical protein RISK_005979 [Rhodopirellula islandica]